MASKAANALEPALGGHDGSAITQQDVTNYEQINDNKSQTMKALVWQGKNKVSIIDTARRPTILEPRDVILRVTGSTLCGSDLHLLHGSVIQLQNGDILGHEFCGVVDEIGSEVQGVEIGGRYVASFQIACGDCYYCHKSLSSQCAATNASATERTLYGSQTAGMFGYSHLTGGFAGGQAEYVRVPLGAVNLLPIPDAVPDERALYLSDVLCTSYHAVHDTGVEKGDEVAVWGAGPIGLMAGVFAALAGAKRVVFVDEAARLKVVESRWPAEHKSLLGLVDYKIKGGVVQRLKELCGDGRGPDVALECAAGEYAKGWLHWAEMSAGLETDTSELVNEMVESVRNFGRCGITGVYVGYTNHFNIGSLMERGIRLIGNGQAPVHKYWKTLMGMLERREFDPLLMVSHRVRLEDLDKVYYKFERHEDGLEKIFVETKFSFPPCEGSPSLTKY